MFDTCQKCNAAERQDFPTESMIDSNSATDCLHLVASGARSASSARSMRLVDGVPVGGGARLQGGLRLIPLGLEILDPRLGFREVALVEQRRDVDDDGAERRQVAELR